MSRQPCEPSLLETRTLDFSRGGSHAAGPPGVGARPAENGRLPRRQIAGRGGPACFRLRTQRSRSVESRLEEEWTKRL